MKFYGDIEIYTEVPEFFKREKRPPWVWYCWKIRMGIAPDHRNDVLLMKAGWHYRTPQSAMNAALRWAKRMNVDLDSYGRVASIPA